MRLLCRYAGGLACLVTALALVACGAGPGSTKEKTDPIGFKDIGELQEGSTKEISLVNTFSGSDLTYTAKSDKPAVATVTVDNDADTLTVTAVGPGMATITVTAKNSQGEAEQTFTVTVPKPPAPDPDPAPVVIPDIPSLEEGASSRPTPLGDKFSGSDLTYSATTSNRSVATVTVDNDADTLTVTAVGAGTATITVTATAQGSATQTKTFTVTVTVPQPEVAPTVRTGAIPSASVAQGGTWTVTLSTVFTGENLEFTVTPSAPAIATASESGGTLTIRGVSIGPATITIVATNDAGSATHPITVTVTAQPPVTTTPTPTPTNNPSSCASPLEILRDDHADCTLPNDHSLVYSIPDGEEERVRVNGPDSSETRNVWTITAIRKGTPVVQIRDNDTGNTVGEITVVVPNSPPRLEDRDGLDAAASLNNAADDYEPMVLGVSPDGLHVATLTAINAAFMDEDDVDTIKEAGDGETVGNGIFNYKVQHKPDELLITTVGGFLLEENSAINDVLIEAVVLKPFTEDFSIEVYAYDPDNDQSDHPITVNFSATTPVTPRTGTYAVKQKENGDFEPVRVGNRLSIPGTAVEHTLQFFDANGLTRTAFQFASNLNGTLTKQVSGKAYLATADVPDLIVVPLCGTEPNANTVPDKESPGMVNVGDACYTYTATNRVEVPMHTDFDPHETSDQPQIGFILPSKTNGLNSGSATITIKYHVHAYSARQDHSDAPNTIPDNAVTRIHTATEPLRINIHKCVVTSDCPME